MKAASTFLDQSLKNSKTDLILRIERQQLSERVRVCVCEREREREEARELRGPSFVGQTRCFRYISPFLNLPPCNKSPKTSNDLENKGSCSNFWTTTRVIANYNLSVITCFNSPKLSLQQMQFSIGIKSN